MAINRKQTKLCSVEGCSEFIFATIYCGKHYTRFRKYGDPLGGSPSRNRDYLNCKISCATCEQVFVGGTAAKYCSRTCSNRGRSRRGLKRSCIVCDTDITERNGNTIYCSPDCQKVGRKGGSGPLTCPGCGIAMEKHHSRQKFCSRECMTHFQDVARRGFDPDGYVQAVHKWSVFHRDNWICQLCDGPVDRYLPWPDPYSPSLDHVVPVSKGGEHTYENTQLAHLRCNIAKGNRYEPAAHLT